MECKESQAPDDVQLKQQQAQSIEAALSCPCVKDLKDGPCGAAFVAAFTCFHKSTADPRGCDCLQENLGFADCLQKHPEAHETMRATRKAGGLQKAQEMAAGQQAAGAGTAAGGQQAGS